MSYVKGLKCRECGKPYPVEPIHVCAECFGPLEVDYDYEAIRGRLTREALRDRPRSMWRYRELLPLDGEPAVGLDVGFTPLVRAERLAKALGLSEVWVKNDAVCHPSLSFKDRVVSAALSKAREFGFETVSCATTGNLGNALAAQAVQGGFGCYIFMPVGLEQGKIIGTSIYGPRVIGISGNYDGVNRLCAEIAEKYRWAFVNINIRPYYAEGSKTFGFEILEQLGFRAPDHVVVPMAGGSLITKIGKAIAEFEKLGLVSRPRTRIHGAQASGCAPIVEAAKAGTDLIRPVKHPQTIAKSIAIGNPADGYYAVKAIRGSGGRGETVTDEEIVDGMRLLAETEGIFTETAGGVTVGVAKKLAAAGAFGKGESLVISITGNGLKTQEAVMNGVPAMDTIGASLSDFDRLYEGKWGAMRAAAPGVRP